MPLSRKYSPIVQPVNGARNCIGAASDAVAALTTEYSIAQKPMGGDALNDLLETMKKSTEVTTTLAPSSQTRVGIIYNQKHPNSTQRDRCRVALQFEAVAGEHYQAVFNYSQAQCGLSITDSKGQSADAVRVDWECP